MTNTGTRYTFSGYEAQTNNQRIEMTAGIRAIEELPIFDTLHIISNSQPLIRGMNEWLPNWKTNGWKTAANNPVANQDLWEQLDRLNQERVVEWTWLKKSPKRNAHKEAYTLAQRAIRSSRHAIDRR
jgi:ribonuclease HI